jgi:branched-chain amino acid transport system substrate-binding protein
MRSSLIKVALAGLFAALATGSAMAQTDQVKIGMIDDESSVYAGLGGKGSLIAIQMAIDDFGGKALGKPIEFKFADHLNKPDLGLNIADGWLQRENFSLIMGGGSSAVLLAVQNAMKSMPTKTLIVTGASSMDFAGKNCTANSIHATTNNYVLLAPTAPSLLKQGDSTWYILSSDKADGENKRNSGKSVY